MAMPPRFSRIPVSRRTALAGLGAGGLGLALASRIHPADAQEGTPSATSGTIPPIAQAWAEAWAAEDPDRLVALYTPDSMFEEVAFGEAHLGTDETRAAVEAEFAAFSQIAVTWSSGFQAGNWAAAEGTFAGVYTGQGEGLPPGTGQQFAVRFAVIFELEGDLIRRESDYFDAYTFLIQLGALPAPGAEGTPTA
jgi:steroid delta-isomerase-like uncharacterized protein